MWNTLLSNIEELNSADLKKALKTLLSKGFEKELTKVSTYNEISVIRKC